MLNWDFEVNSSWYKTIDHVMSPGRCCAACQQSSRCHSWTWLRDAGLRPISAGPSQCWLKSNGTTRKVPKLGVVSGMIGQRHNTSDTEPALSMDDVLTQAYGGLGIREHDLCKDN